MTTLLNLVRSYWVAITLICLVVITMLSVWPLESLPDVPGDDKIRHFIAYAGLMFPVALRKPRYWLLIGLSFIGWSGGLELIQPYVNRYGEWLDMAANCAGVVCGVLAAHLLNSVFGQKPEAACNKADPG